MNHAVILLEGDQPEKAGLSFCLKSIIFHINFKPGNHTPLGMWRKGLFLQKNKKYLILLLSPEKFVILNMREHKLMKSAERRDTDASKRTGRDDIHKSKTVS